MTSTNATVTGEHPAAAPTRRPAASWPGPHTTGGRHRAPRPARLVDVHRVLAAALIGAVAAAQVLTLAFGGVV